MADISPKPSWLIFAWPVLLVLFSSVFQFGYALNSLEQVESELALHAPMATRLAVLESELNPIREDLSEIKDDLKIIRQYIIENK